MDMFGIGTAMVAITEIYFLSARRSGRTMSMVENLKDGDRIVFTNSKEAARVKRLCNERGVDIACVVVDPYKTTNLFQLGTGQGRTVFDHVWVENFYLRVIRTAQQDLDNFETQLSGYGPAHRETLQKVGESFEDFRKNL